MSFGLYATTLEWCSGVRLFSLTSQQWPIRGNVCIRVGLGVVWVTWDNLGVGFGSAPLVIDLSTMTYYGPIHVWEWVWVSFWLYETALE